MPPVQRLLIQTHHMTSRKKIAALTRSAKKLNCSVVLKTGSPPGIMIAESENDEAVGVSGGVKEWEAVVRRLRYKDFEVRRRGVVEKRGLDVSPGSVKELSSVRELKELLEVNDEILRWWKVGMGYEKEDVPP